jgi:DNA-binding transcriptional LysR family regulator
MGLRARRRVTADLGGWPGYRQRSRSGDARAVDGLGVAYTIEALADPYLRSGQLLRVLEDWSPSFEGLFLYYPGHRQVPIPLRALIDMLRTARGSAQTRGPIENPFAAK